MNHVFITRTSLLIPALLACATFGTPARADGPFNDVVTVKGDALRGRVVRLTDKAVEFRTVYGDGDLSIPYEDVEALGSLVDGW